MNIEINPIEAHEQNLKRIFSADYAFEIPAYQRPYAWELDQTRQLLADLLEEVEKPNSGTYFLGSIVLIKSPGRAQSHVVDGQQRLTTLTILLSIIRDLTSDTKLRFSRAQLVMQLADQDAGVEQGCRLLLRRDDRAFFQKVIQEEGATLRLPESKFLRGSQQRIVENAHHLRDELRALGEVSRDRLMAFVLQRCFLVVVAVPSPESARRIFTVLNARGLDLTPTDILKASFLDRVKGTEAQSLAAENWENIENAVGRDGMVELFGHIRMIHERDKARTALDAGFPSTVKSFSEGAPEEFLRSVLGPIAEIVLFLRDTARVEERFGLPVARAVRSLERVDNKDWLPPAILRLWRCKPGDDDAAGVFLIGLERLAYYLFVTRQGINERIARFSAVMDEFEPRADRGAPKQGIDLTDLEKARFRIELDGPLYLKTRVCKPVLQRLDEELSTLGAKYDGLVSIEHVLPQTIDQGSQWDLLFPSVEERAEWTHRVSNLIFLTRAINSRASNWDFERKKNDYFKSKGGRSPFPLTQTVLEAPSWNIDRLRIRQKELIDRFAQIWQF